jgi:hypothetical protein
MGDMSGGTNIIRFLPGGDGRREFDETRTAIIDVLANRDPEGNWRNEYRKIINTMIQTALDGEMTNGNFSVLRHIMDRISGLPVPIQHVSTSRSIHALPNSAEIKDLAARCRQRIGE